MQPGMIHSLTQIPNDLEKEGGMSVFASERNYGQAKRERKNIHIFWAALGIESIVDGELLSLSVRQNWIVLILK